MNVSSKCYKSIAVTTESKQRKGMTSPSSDSDDTREKRRNLISFWIIGLCNNFGYVVMLSAAFDILKDQGLNVKSAHNGTDSSTNKNDEFAMNRLQHNRTQFHCNPTSTGVILLADILPSILVKLTAPFYMQKINYHIRFAFVLLCFTSSLLILAFSPTILVSILAVVLASLSSGLGEITFLSLSSHFKRSTVSAWSSGTGMSGVTGSVAYAGLRQVGLTKRNAVLLLLVVPLIFAISIWIILKFPAKLRKPFFADREVEPIAMSPNKSTVIAPTTTGSIPDRTRYMSLKMKLEIILSLRRYMLPLFIVYLAEYTINQGLYEMLFYDVSWLTQAQQYRWFQVDYQIAVFLSRSSVYLFHVKKVMYLAVGQCFLFFLVLSEVYFTFIPYIWITLAIIFLEGLFGGAVYVNTFFRMSEELEADIREFSLGAASFGDSCGVGLAGLISMPLHSALCRLKTS